ncbi:MAG: hypothetical protein V8R14_05660 [Clostridia bacterium]
MTQSTETSREMRTLDQLPRNQPGGSRGQGACAGDCLDRSPEASGEAGAAEIAEGEEKEADI